MLGPFGVQAVGLELLEVDLEHFLKVISFPLFSTRTTGGTAGRSFYSLFLSPELSSASTAELIFFLTLHNSLNPGIATTLSNTIAFNSRILDGKGRFFLGVATWRQALVFSRFY